LGYILGDFFTNSPGHPAWWLDVTWLRYNFTWNLNVKKIWHYLRSDANVQTTDRQNVDIILLFGATGSG
jgi:hypothetical protein